MFAADIPGSTCAHAVEYLILQPSLPGIGVHLLVLHSSPQRQHPQSIWSCRGFSPAFAEVTAEDHPDKVGESEAGEPLPSPQVSQCITFHLHHKPPLSLREKNNHHKTHQAS